MLDSTLQDLVDGLRGGQALDLNDRQITALLTWLGGAASDTDAALLRGELGTAGDDEQVRAAAFDQLAFSLFVGERLLLDSSGLDADRDDKDRRRRFRLLLSVFHPDRDPARADWLTSRLQIVNRAYALFKAGRLDDGDPQPGPKHQPGAPGAAGKAAPPWRGISPSWTMTEKLRARLGKDRFLGHKVIAILALVIALPVISVLLDSPSGQVGTAPVDDRVRLEQRWIGEDLELSVDRWPLASLEPAWRVAKVTDMGESTAGSVDGGAIFMARDNPGWLGVAKVARVEVVEDEIENEVQEDIEEVVEAGLVVADGGESDAGMTDGSDLREVEVLVEEKEVPGEPVEESALEVAEVVISEVGDVEDDVAIGEFRPSGTRSDDLRSGASRRRQTAPDLQSELPRPTRDVAMTEIEGVDESVLLTNVDDSEESGSELSGGSVSLGPLGHHQAGALLRDYWESVESGDLDGVLRVLARQPRENDNEGREWFERQYDALFKSSNRRALHLQVLNAQRSGNEWMIQAHYRLDMERVGSDELESLEREVVYSISPDPFRLRISSIEY